MKHKKNLIIEVEILKREIESKIYLGLSAALKDFRVIIGREDHLKFAIEKYSINSGIYLMKCVSKGRKSTMDLLSKRNFSIFQYDVESSIAEISKERFFEFRGSLDAVKKTKKFFCWGKEEQDGWKKKYPKYKNKFLLSGSLASTLWTPNFEPYYNNKMKIIKKKYNDFVLIVSTFYKTNNVENESDYNEIVKNESKFQFRFANKKEENLRLKALKEDHKLFVKFAKFVDEISKKNPKLNFVIRLHPLEQKNKWKNFISNQNGNIYFDSEGTISSFIRSSKLVMHNGCTSGFETFVSKVPTAVYMPFKIYRPLGRSNVFGFKVKNHSDFKYTLKILDNGLSKNRVFFNPKKKRIFNQILQTKDLFNRPLSMMLKEFFKTKVPKDIYRYSLKIYLKSMIFEIKRFLKSIGFIKKNWFEEKFFHLKKKDVENIKYNLQEINPNFKNCSIKNYFGNIFILEKK